MLIAIMAMIISALATFVSFQFDSREGQQVAAGEITEIHARQFISYKNLVMSYQEQLNAPPPTGAIADSSLSPPIGWNLPTYARGAEITSAGWVVVWADMEGEFFQRVFQGSDSSTAVCLVDQFRDCRSSRRVSAVVNSAELPTHIREGMTVYVWKT